MARKPKSGLKVKDVPSKGTSSRIVGIKSGQTHHVFSQLESDIFGYLDLAAGIHDIRTQHALPLSETVQIARDLGIRPPIAPGTVDPVEMTTDFVFRRDGIEVAWSAKYHDALQNERTIEKLEIERQYWEAHGVEWRIITEKQLSPALIHNVRWLRAKGTLRDAGVAGDKELSQIKKWLEGNLAEEEGLSALCRRCDDALGLDSSVALSCVRYLLASGRWQTDFSEKIDPGKPLKLIAHDAYATGPQLPNRMG